MEQKRFDEIDERLAAALQIEPEARAAFLRQVCAGDDELRRAVEFLLSQGGPSEKLEVTAVAYLAEVLAGQAGAVTTGQRINHYTIKACIGRGGMGEVWRAWDEKLERDVALKLLPLEFAADPERVVRFRQEALTISALNHANIVAIYDSGQVTEQFGELHFIVTELVEGETLRAQLKQSALDWRKVVPLATQMAEALHAAHTVGIIHRDIKPENIMMQADGRLKVLDFGIAKLRDEGGGMRDESGRPLHPSSFIPHPSLTAAGAMLGTLKYMSPEQARGEVLEVQTDIFSLGLVLYEMLAGRHPYSGKSGAELSEALQSADEIPPLSALNAALPAALERSVTRALKKRRAERYESAGELLADLKELKSLIEVGRDAQQEQLLKAQNADQLLTRYVVFHEADRQTRIPLGSLWSIWRFASLKRGRLERELIRKSFFSGLLGAGWRMLLIAAVTMLVAAWLSVTDVWEERVLRDGHTAAVRRAVFSPDGKLLVSVSEDKQVIVWDFEKRERLATLNEHKAEVVSVAFAPDGKRFATQSRDGVVIVWDTARRAKIAEWRDSQESPLDGLAFSPDGRLLAYSVYDGNANTYNTRLRETVRWEQVSELRDASGRSFIFSHNSRQLMPAGEWKIFDPATGRQLAGARSDGGNWIALSPDAARLAKINSAGEVSVYQLTRPGDLTRTKLLHRERAHDDHGRTVEFSPDGRLIASGAEHVVLWNAVTLKREAVLEHTSIVWSVAFAPDGRWLVSTHGDGSILVWDLVTRTRAANFNEHSGPVRAVAFASDGQRIASASEDRSIIIWNAATARKEAVLAGHEARINGVAFAPDGQSLAAAAQDHTLRLWDVAQQQLRWQVTDVDLPGYCAALSPDGRWVATTVGVYERASGRQRLDLRSSDPNPRGQIYGAAFSADGRRLACVTEGGWLLIWEVATWQLRARQQVPATHQISVSFAPDGQTLVTGEDEGALRLWRTEPLTQLAVIGQHQARIKSVAYAPDGETVASASDDKTLALWDVTRRRLITQIGTHTAPVLAVAFAPDGKQLVAGGHDRTVRLYTRRRSLWGWRAPTELLNYRILRWRIGKPGYSRSGRCPPTSNEPSRTALPLLFAFFSPNTRIVSLCSFIPRPPGTMRVWMCAVVS
ncbi:MAG: protein kinase [Acidobacteria bacterium]|nr:protein kinase [Acidobacteriota bacterium]MBI3421619.1 protein kinase [Acidobacteriota bacterium]